MDNEMGAPETKAELNNAFGEFMGAFEVFRETNDRRLAELEKKGADVLTVDKLARVEAALDAQQRRMDEMVLRGARPSLMGGAPVAANETKSAFGAFVRSGDEQAMRALETKAMASDGGLAMPVEVEAEVMRRLAEVSPFRSIATVRSISATSFRKAVPNGLTGAWASDETTARPADATTLKALNFPTGELYAVPAASSVLVEDAAIDVGEWLAGEIEMVFAEQETKAFVIGNGTTQPKGIVTYAGTTEAGDLANETLGVVKTGQNGAFPTVAPSDALVDLVYSLKASYRQNAHFVMNRSTQAHIRKLKDGEGEYLWTPPSVPGGRAGLMSFPIVEAEDMPEFTTTGACAIAFGDFRRGYLIVDRQGIKVLRDPYSAKPNVLFYTTKRVGGGVQDFDAIKLLQFAA
ncbi:phage major capsid protein [Acuticoccus sediminis]|uniref:phage major capsid protein n=1 Tax=Acuticoccus sediminis TaxID=2184697 RepID=UPI001CFD9B01|nr:phage major capsid protein [Acuticoccus sediminis]